MLNELPDGVPVERRLRSERGASLVELAVALPLLVLIVVGTVDFARVFYVAIGLTNAARAGAQYGSQEGKYTETANMETTAVAAASLNPPATAAASWLCQCVTDDGTFSATSPVNDCSAACAGAHLVISVTVTASRIFTTVSRFPGIPHVLTISRAATLRAK